MESQRAVKIKGGTMRLGAYDCDIKKGTKTFSAYKKNKVSERHRHRYEVNNRYRRKLENGGMVFPIIQSTILNTQKVQVQEPDAY